MKSALLLLLFSVSLLFSAYTGETTVRVVKTWVVVSNHSIPHLTLNGTFLLDNGFQEVSSLNVSEGAVFEAGEDGIRVVYSAENYTGETTITASALVYAKYPPGIPENPLFVASALEAEGPIEYDQPMADLASSLAQGKTRQLEVLASLLDWTHEYVDYDLVYLGDPAPAMEVFQVRSGVCVGYVHLFMALASSLGFETRFVSGYAFSSEWEDHAWAEVRVGDSWVPADPTFREMGMLDARHIAISYSDGSGARDVLVSKGVGISTEGITFNSSVFIQTANRQEYPETLFVHTVLHEDDLKVVVYNPTDFYLTPAYHFSVPDYLHTGEVSTLVLAPGETKALAYHLNTDELEPGYSHSLPYRISLQGTTLDDELVIIKGNPTSAPDSDARSSVGSEECPLVTGAVLLVLASLFSLRRNA